MSDLTLIRDCSPRVGTDGACREVRLRVSRATLAKRRWRGAAEDGREFGFDLEHALAHGKRFFAEGDKQYVLEQAPEEVLEIPFETVEQAARLAWGLGNLHFGVQILPAALRVKEDPAVLQFLSREGVSFQRTSSLFLPLSVGAHPHHAHSHHDHE